MPESNISKLPRFYLFTDGSYSKTYKTGGASYVLLNEHGKPLRLTHRNLGAVYGLTSQVAELFGVLMGLKDLHEWIKNTPSGKREIEVVLVSDSAYVIQGMSDWSILWHDDGQSLKNKAPSPDGKNDPKKNYDIWKALLGYKKKSPDGVMMWFKYVKVPGHAGYFWNEMADSLALMASKKDFLNSMEHHAGGSGGVGMVSPSYNMGGGGGGVSNPTVTHKSILYHHHYQHQLEDLLISEDTLQVIQEIKKKSGK